MQDKTRWGILGTGSIAKKFAPGTEPFETADHAISLALSPRRSAEDGTRLFFHSWRDARRIRRRRKFREPILDSFAEDSPIGAAIANGNEAGVCAGECPVAAVVARDLEARLRRAADRIGPIARECLESMLLGERIEYVRQTHAKYVVTDNSRGGKAYELAAELRSRLGVDARPSTNFESREWGT